MYNTQYYSIAHTWATYVYNTQYFEDSPHNTSQSLAIPWAASISVREDKTFALIAVPVWWAKPNMNYTTNLLADEFGQYCNDKVYQFWTYPQTLQHLYHHSKLNTVRVVKRKLTVLMNSMGIGVCSSSCWRTTASTSWVYTDLSWKQRFVAGQREWEKNISVCMLWGGGCCWAIKIVKISPQKGGGVIRVGQWLQ